MGNYENVARWREKNKKICLDCDKSVAWDSDRCKPCTGLNKTRILHKRTIGEQKKLVQGSRWRDSIRLNAKFLCKTRDKICFICGYNKLIDIAHIKAISSFPDSATIGEVNSLSNLVMLCKRCHYEYDGGLIPLAQWIEQRPTEP